MNIRVLVLAIGGLILAAAIVVFVFLRPADSPPAADAAASTPERSVAPEAPSAAGNAVPAPRAPASAPAAPRAPAAALTTATLRVESDVPGALVFLDREYQGTTPLTLENLPPGRRQLNVSAERFDAVARTIDLEPGPQDVRVSLREVRLDAAADVVHRHRLGSCRGRLVADVNGIRYQTDHEDAFSASLADLEVFEVDYLENNLRVRIRGGRQYNFTDPEGNADRIFVFHREVARAREQLAR